MSKDTDFFLNPAIQHVLLTESDDDVCQFLLERVIGIQSREKSEHLLELW